MKLGVLQGRLSPPVGGHYQEFPEDWNTEVDVLHTLGLKGVEWLITKNKFLDNPLINSDLSGVPILSVCLDNLVDEKIDDYNFLKDNLTPVCEAMLKLGIKNATIPILDESDLSSTDKRSTFCEIMEPYGDIYPDINFCFEAEMPPEELREIVDLRDNFYVTYDTGNITSSGINHELYIEFFKEKILNVHIKDRTFDRKTVAPTTGDTPFDLIFKKLNEIEYNGFYILQTARGISGKEIETIEEHKRLIENLYDRYF